MSFWRRMPVLRVRQGDVLVVDAGDGISQEQAFTIKAMFDAAGVKVAVMSGLKVVAVQEAREDVL